MISTRTLFHRLVATLLVLVATFSTVLADESGTGWSYNSSTNTLTLCGSEVDWYAIKDFSSTTENVVFAADYAVSTMPSKAFYKFSKLTAIDIPNVVTSIEATAFYGCTALASIFLPEELQSIGIYAFYGCTTLSSVSLPASLTSLGTVAFAYCTSLTSITLPASLTSIDEYAFAKCTALSSVSLSEGLQSIGFGAFLNCASLTSITLPASLTSIDESAFAECTSLSSVEILSNGTSDNKHVIYLGSDSDDKTTTGGDDVFPIHQATLIYDPNTTWIGDDDTQNLRYYFTNFVRTGGAGWSYNSSFNTLTLSGSEVDWDAIKYFSSTTEKVVFAKNYSVSSIPNGAFKGFSKLADIDISSVVTSIGNYAFSGCSTLASVSLPANLTTVEYCTFSGCTSLASVVLPDGLESIVDEAFFCCTSLSSVSLPASLTSLGGSAFYGCTSLSSVSLPASLTSLGTVAFAYCTSLTSITLPASLTSIDEYAFAKCTALSSVSLSEGLQSIGFGAFLNCASLTSITLPASLTSIDESAFAECTSLSSVEILSNGTSDNKHVIYLGSDSDDKTTTGGDDVFPIHQATLIYDPNTTWIGDGDTQNLRYYFNSFATPTSLPAIDAPTSAPQYYDLCGRPISPTTHKGVAVKLQDEKSSLVTIK